MEKYMIKQFIFLLIILSAAGAAHAQTEQPARTWIGGGVIVTKSISPGDFTDGLYFDAAYDLRHGLQLRGQGEYRREATIRNLFVGRAPGTSELRYGGSLIYHLPGENFVRPFFGGGVLAVSQFGFGRGINTSVNPLYLVGADLGRNHEFTFTHYFKDVYANSGLRGYGFDYAQTRRLSGRLNLRFGARARIWDSRGGEVIGIIGFHFQ